MIEAVLCLFTRAPVRGEVKRRLAAEVGDAAALMAHCRLLEHALVQLSGLSGVATEVWVAGSPAAVAPMLPAGIQALRRQPEGDLGRRMCAALECGLRQASRAMVVGSDCPSVNAAYVAQAVAALDGHDVVLGPAEDGGYGLIGVARSAAAALPALFDDVPWGTSRVLEVTLERVRAQSLQVSLLAEIWDVDDAAGWQRFLAGD